MSAPRVSFVSIGCPTALVDSERIITRLRAEGYEIARKHDGADLVVVNTCGFLDSPRENHPQLLAIPARQAGESRMAAVHEAAPPAQFPGVDLRLPQGVKLTP